MRWNAGDQSELDLGAKKVRLRSIFLWKEVVVFKTNGHYKDAANDCNCLSQQLDVLSSAFMYLDGLLYICTESLD